MPRYRKAEGQPYRRAKARVRREERTCWLCGEPIDLTHRFPHPRSFTVDHITPVELGGAQTDRRNMRAAHLRCNQRRGLGRRAPIRQTRRW